VFV
jgi:hypothetical protein